jgi:flagellar hook-basal body complex protein FliE
MSVNPLTPNLIHLFNSAALSTDPSRFTESEGNFADVLAEAFGAASHTDAVDKLSSLELLMGESDDLSGLMIDMQKAELSLNLALQIRNKVIDAYNEVMRMSV